ncbi:MAG: DUF3606 domain-containing protein [Rhodanobacter sp.]
MDDRINLFDRLSRAHWCGNFSCSDQELAAAICATGSTEVGVVGLYLATRYETSTLASPQAGQKMGPKCIPCEINTRDG